MDFYGDANCGQPAPEPAPMPVPEPAPLPAYEPPACPPAPEIFPDRPAAPAAAPAAPAMPVHEAPPAVPTYQPVAEAPLSSGTLLGPSVVGGTADLSGSGFVGGTPDLSGSGFVGGSADPGLTWVDSNGTPVAPPYIPVIPGPFNGFGDHIVAANNSAISNGWLGGASSPSPAYWTPGFDSDHDGISNERDTRPRDPFATTR